MANRFLFVGVFVVLFAPVALAQQIYKWKDEKGQSHFSDAPPPWVEAEKVGGLEIPASQPQTEKSQPVSSPEKIVVPFTREGGHVIVEGVVNGRDTVKFILDTGAEGTLIPFALVQQSGINIDNSVLIPHSGIGGVLWDPVVEIDSLKVAEAEVRNLGVTIVREGFLVRKHRGVLGANFLDDFRVEIKYDQNQVALERLKGPYAGYPPEWWQKRFRYYNGLKKFYEKLRKESYVRMTSNLAARCIQARLRMTSPGGRKMAQRMEIPRACLIEDGLHSIEKKLRNLNIRAIDTGVPWKFRQ